MACTALLTQVSPAIFGAPCFFVLSVTNADVTDGATILSIDVSVINQAGTVATAVNIGDVAVPPGVSSIGAVGTSQYNILIPASGTRKFSFPISFFGASVAGAVANSSPTYTVGATLSARDEGDDSVFSFAPGGIVVPMNRPQFGPAPGAPPNMLVRVGQLNFTSAANSALAF